MYTQVVWFYRNLRIQDNHALYNALLNGPTIGIYVMDSDFETGAAQAVWLNQSLGKLAHALANYNVPLLVLNGNALAHLSAFATTNGATIHHSHNAEPYYNSVINALMKSNKVIGYQDSYLIDPSTINTAAGTPYTVFTPFCDRLKTLLRAPLLPLTPTAPHLRVTTPLTFAPTTPTHAWEHKLTPYLASGEDVALAKLKLFLPNLAHYELKRNEPASLSNSNLSTHLHFGEISPTTIIHELRKYSLDCTFQSEIIWREFSNYCLYHNPTLSAFPINHTFSRFPWKPTPSYFSAWKKGLTGYPIVDAGMRELYATGFMHNRIRMITASFLIKHLLHPWQDGEKWFRHCLFDGDLAANAMNWQWVAGCGVDPAPFFRIFSPALQTEKYDSTGDYIYKWVPELTHVPPKLLSTVTDMSPSERTLYKIPTTYPLPIVDYKVGRKLALDAYNSLKL